MNNKDLFILEEGITYLNCGNMSPMLKSVKEAGLAGIETRSKPWKLSAADWFTDAETLRGLAAQLFNAAIDDIALIPSASYGLAAAAKNLKPAAGKEILILDHQFPSNYYAWEKLAEERDCKLVTVKRSTEQSLTACILEKITDNTGIVAIPNCHWIDGIWIDLEQVSDKAKAAGSFLVLDLSQSLGVLPIDIKRINPDFAVAVGYKWLLGPYSLGYMYVSKKWQEEGDPLEYSWMTKKGSDDFTKLTDYVAGYRPGARRFDMGEFSQFNQMPMAIAGLQQILTWGIGNIQNSIKQLTDKLIDYKKATRIFNPLEKNVGHMVSVPLDKLNAPELKTRLNAKKIVISFRGTSIRVTPHLYNDAFEIDDLIDCMQ